MIKHIINYIKNYFNNLFYSEKNIDVQSIKLVSPFVLIINFRLSKTVYSKDSELKKPIIGYDNYYVVLHGDYKEIRKKYNQNLENEYITFEQFKEEIGLLIPIEDVLNNLKHLWILKE